MTTTDYEGEIDRIMIKHMQHTGWNGRIEAEVYQLARKELLALLNRARINELDIEESSLYPEHVISVTLPGEEHKFTAIPTSDFYMYRVIRKASFDTALLPEKGEEGEL